MTDETNEVVGRRRRLLVGLREESETDPLGDEPAMSLEELERFLSERGMEVEPLRASEARIFRATVTPEQAEQLYALQARTRRVIVEENQPLELDQVVEVLESTAMQVLPSAESATLRLRLADREDGSPVAGATVFVADHLLPIRGVSDENGDVQITLFGPDTEHVSVLFVNPGASGHWNRWLTDPQLDVDTVNVVQLERIDLGSDGGPGRDHFGWGQTAMRMPEDVAGLGREVRVAVIDSGLAGDHEDLQGDGGFDFTGEGSATDAWNVDTVGHGSHVGGTVDAILNTMGTVGIAPDSEQLVFKVFPGGRIDWLIEALHRAAEQGAMVANMSLGFTNASELVHQAIRAVSRQGMACIAAAGNSEGPVKYPAAYPEVLPVAALGRQDTFPADSRHANQVGHQATDDSGFFSAGFTCFGPEIAERGVCAPGVAVISTVPGGGYAAWDGTSMACPHVTGVAAAILSQRPEIRAREGQARVDALFAAIREASSEVPGIPAEYQGAGLPDIRAAIGPPTPEPWSRLLDMLEDALDFARSHA